MGKNVFASKGILMNPPQIAIPVDGSRAGPPGRPLSGESKTERMEGTFSFRNPPGVHLHRAQTHGVRRLFWELVFFLPWVMKKGIRGKEKKLGVQTLKKVHTHVGEAGRRCDLIFLGRTCQRHALGGISGAPPLAKVLKVGLRTRRFQSKHGNMPNPS